MDEDDFLPSYGHFLGGDPRCFYPDPECTLADELERWKGDCEAWDTIEAGHKPDRGGPHIPLVDNEGREMGHLTVSHYGLGTTELDSNPKWRERYDDIRRFLQKEGAT